VKFTPRIRLYGKRVTEEQITREIFNLLHGNDQRPYPLSVAEIAKIFDVNRNTVYNYIKRMKLQKSQTGRLNLPKIPIEKQFRQFNKHHPITSDQLVGDWMDDITTRKGGEPIKTWKTRMQALEAVCNSCEIHPSDLLVSQRNTEKILRQYAQLARQGKDFRRTIRKRNGIKCLVYFKVQAVRDFCGFYGITWRRGITGIMSQRVVNHGQYADVRLSQKELNLADFFIKKRWGLDSDVYRWFWIGIESCARFDALYNMSLDYEPHTNAKTEKTTYIMIAFESKTESLRGGKWYKYITKQDTQKSIDLLKSRGGTRIHECKIPKYLFKRQISKEIALVFQSIGKTNQYFQNHPTHALRHIGAQHWLAKKDFNYGLVSEIGGWHTIDELKKSYGMIPPEKILEIIEN